MPSCARPCVARAFAGCKGRKVVEQAKELQVQIVPGMREGQRITFHGDADQAPDMETGDVVVVLVNKAMPENDEDKEAALESDKARLAGLAQPIRHRRRPQFDRLEKDPNNLLISHTITLLEALTGWSYTFQHLDDRWVTVTSPAGRVCSHGDIVIVKGEGMPRYKVRWARPQDASHAG